jgi:hypothetical protein
VTTVQLRTFGGGGEGIGLVRNQLHTGTMAFWIKVVATDDRWWEVSK